MPYEILSEDWMSAFQDTINHSQAYKAASRTWEWPVVLMVQADAGMGIPADRSMYLDLWHGECRQAHAATADDLARSAFIISANPSTWKQVFDHTLEPVAALMRGKLALAKGSIITLIRYAPAAKELVMLAALVDTCFPAESS